MGRPVGSLNLDCDSLIIFWSFKYISLINNQKEAKLYLRSSVFSFFKIQLMGCPVGRLNPDCNDFNILVSEYSWVKCLFTKNNTKGSWAMLLVYWVQLLQNPVYGHPVGSLNLDYNGFSNFESYLMIIDQFRRSPAGMRIVVGPAKYSPAGHEIYHGPNKITKLIVSHLGISW